MDWFGMTTKACQGVGTEGVLAVSKSIDDELGNVPPKTRAGSSLVQEPIHGEENGGGKDRRGDSGGAAKSGRAVGREGANEEGVADKNSP